MVVGMVEVKIGMPPFVLLHIVVDMVEVLTTLCLVIHGCSTDIPPFALLDMVADMVEVLTYHPASCYTRL